MAGYVRIKPSENLTWAEIELASLEGLPLGWLPETEWVESVCFDAMGSGLYVLTDDGGDSYFTAHSIYLEHRDEVPNDYHEDSRN